MRLALFDLDGTVLRGNSWHEYFWWITRQRPRYAPRLLAGLVLRRARLISARTLKDAALGPLAGLDASQIRELGQRVWREKLRAMVRTSAREEISRCRADGYEPVFASAAFDFLVRPVAQDLGVAEVVSTQIEYTGSLCRGQIAGSEVRGPTKASSVRSHFAHRDIDWRRSRAYTDELEDVPLLGLVGEPVFVTTDGRRPAGLRDDIRVATWHDA